LFNRVSFLGCFLIAIIAEAGMLQAFNIKKVLQKNNYLMIYKNIINTFVSFN